MILFLYNFYLSQPEVNIEEVISTFLKLAMVYREILFTIGNNS